MHARLSILQLSAADEGGGAEDVAARLAAAYARSGHRSVLAVGRRRSGDGAVVEVPNAGASRTAWSRHWRARADELKERRRYHRARVARALADPRTVADLLAGREDMRHPGSHVLLDRLALRPSIVQAHNLHGGWFDLRALPAVAAAAPLVLTLHDSWLFTGHCAHPLDGERWLTGCGSCPRLDLYPALHRDGTAANWRRKQEVFRRVAAHAAAPSRWLLERAERSLLGPALRERRVIPNGVDLGFFSPGDAATARTRLGLPPGARVVLFAARGITRSHWRDWPTLRAALSALGERNGPPLVFLGAGEERETEQLGNCELRFVGDLGQGELADAYRAADVYVHAAHVDTFPGAVLEALASGLPVVATAVGGIPEQVRVDGPERTGLLVPRQAPAELAAALSTLLEDEPMRRALGAAARRDAEARFDERRQARAYLDWFQELAAAS